jgi:hypothetical protein
MLGFLIHLTPLFVLKHIASRPLIASAATAAFFVPLVTFWDQPLVIAISAAVPIYVAILLAFPTIRHHEVVLLLTIGRDFRANTEDRLTSARLQEAA